mmetsp:Transcript_1211/g.2553  ORF Transcript_1211/g.2553 Transcript_1211/m.2553 type:complete len:103 (+) Transcript_1211:399-707(+)
MDSLFVVLHSPSGSLGNASKVAIEPLGAGFNLTVLSSTLSGNVRYQVQSQPCGGSFAAMKIVGVIRTVGGSLMVTGCSCYDIVVRARYNSMFGAFSRISTHI